MPCVVPGWLEGPRCNFDQLKRREFITLLGGAAGSVAAGGARAAVGDADDDNPGSDGRPAQPLISELREGLAAAGYVEGRNLKVEYRWANNQEEQLAGAFGGRSRWFACECHRCHSGHPSWRLQRNRPRRQFQLSSRGRHQSGEIWPGCQPEPARRQHHRLVTSMVTELAGKRFDLLCEMVPEANTIGFLFPGRREAFFSPRMVTIV